jgi:hypothetical protein
MASFRVLGFFGLTVSISAALVAPLFAGCGSGSPDNTGGGGSVSHVGGSHVGGSHVGGSHVGGAAPDCAALAADETGTPVPVRIVNQTGSDLYLYLDNDCGETPFRIKDPNGDELLWSDGGSCDQTCADFDCICTVTCAHPPLARIAANGTATVTWKGVVREQRTLPASCIEPSSFCTPGEPCRADVVPKQFPLTFVGVGWTELMCGSGTCDCTPDANGVCTYDFGVGASPTGDALEATATLAAGGAAVDLVFKGP